MLSAKDRSGLIHEGLMSPPKRLQSILHRCEEAESVWQSSLAFFRVFFSMLHKIFYSLCESVERLVSGVGCAGGCRLCWSLKSAAGL